MHLEEEADDGKDPESDDPGGIKGVTEELLVQLARMVIDAQAEEKHYYHCSSPKHFIYNCPIMKATRDKKQLIGKEGMAMMKGAWTLLTTMSRRRLPRHKNHLTDSLLESRSFPAMVQN